jgi:hypothetical protein
VAFVGCEKYMELSEENYNSLKKIIESSGHPVSLKTSTILQKKGWYVRNSPRFTSKSEDGVLKEIDIISVKKSKIFEDSENTLIIECKKQRDPWIFFEQNHKNDRIFTLNVNFAGFYEGCVDYSKESESIFKKHYYYNRKLCTYFIVGGKNPDKGGPGGTIDRAINQLYNAIEFYVNQSTNDFSEFFYPIIVFDGEMFKASYKGQKLVIQPSDHISLFFEIEFSQPKFLETVKSNVMLTSKPYVFDIVKLSYLERFLSEIDQKI